MEEKECIYDICWTGICNNPTVSDSEFCENHLGAKCKDSILKTEKHEKTFSLSQDEIKEMLEKNLGIQDIEFVVASFDIVGRGIEIKRIHSKCGEQAVGDCHSHDGPGVCGTPLCKEHQITHKHNYIFY